MTLGDVAKFAWLQAMEEIPIHVSDMCLSAGAQWSYSSQLAHVSQQ